MHAHQEKFVDWLVDLVNSEDIELLVLAGDIYDRAVPPQESVRLFDAALTRLSALCPVFITPGNHDSAVRLGFGRELLGRNGVHISATLEQIAEPLEIEGRDGTQLVVYGIPYLQPEVFFTELNCERSHTGVLTAAMDLVREDLVDRVEHDPDTRSVVISHAFITGGSESESERSLEIGGIGDCPSYVFDGIDYVAMGHLHGQQIIATPDGSTTIVRYSGSPLAYSFSEEKHHKSVTIVQIPAVGNISFQVVPTPVPAPLVTIKGELQDLLTNKDHDAHVDSWVRAILTDRTRQENAWAQLEKRFPHLKEIKPEPEKSGIEVDVRDRLDPQSNPPIEIVAGFIKHVTGAEMDAAQRVLVQSAIEEINRKSESA